ncbi:hypothetical protein CANARDRAFT_28370 [[Candida] arabinofermentans NRRL YB-2248]|uniref:CHCH domain-containing protein n=1 Tax=[Candida] arabinofermentans NRRL YB-2248 TaxID=983967 RepID=A0A1E4T1N4_9ASCO|nr:hypothetical protein CANARDRAFT_28370 [[Candida] arabinofermentans NRRL YB-2248]
MSNDPKNTSVIQDDDDEPDEWDKRINKTGCAEENLKLQLCHADTNDWRKCLDEVRMIFK